MRLSEARHPFFSLIFSAILGLTCLGMMPMSSAANQEGKACETSGICCPPQDAQTVTTQGSGEIKVFPDTFSLEVTIASDDASLEKARQTSTQKTTALRNALKALNLKSLQLQTMAFNLYPIYKATKGERLPKLLGYHVSNQLKVKAVGLSPEELADVASRVLAIASEHASATGSLSFYLANPRPSQLKALELASQNARDQAQAMATGAGARLGNVQMLSSGYSQPIPMNVQAAPRMKMMETDADAPPPPPVEVSESTISADVQARFELLKPLK
ncbi:MAG: SIMPL domain-containing protein [Vampirovibrionales bacterium]|nr:SIMPL domain-containing protein [Vampirovibrionales bacterium]